MANPTIRTCAVCNMENDQPGSICRPCSDALHHLTNQDGIWAGLTAVGARLARSIAIKDSQVPDQNDVSKWQRLSLAHPVAAGRYDTLHPDLDPFWQWVAMKQARENPRGDFIRDTRVLIHVGKNPGSRLWSACDEARREYSKLCRQWELRSAPANTPTGAETP